MARLAPWLMPRHGAEEVAQAIGIRVELLEGIIAAVARLVLRFAGAKRGGEIAPEAVETSVGHLQDAADVLGLLLVEEELGGRGICVVAVAALEAVERDEGVEEVAGRAWVKADAAADAGESLGAFGEYREELEFHGAEQDFGGPEACAYLKQTFRCGSFHEGSSCVLRWLHSARRKSADDTQARRKKESKD